MGDPLPRLRPVDAFPVEVDGRRLVYLRDPLGYAPEGVLVPYPAFFILTLLDGNHSLADVQEAFARRYGEILTREQVEGLLAQLDENYYLDTEHFATLAREVAERFAASPLRPLAHAGSCYDPDPEGFRAQMEGIFTHPEAPGLPQATGRAPRLRGLVAPHIDLRVGGPCYAWAYRELAERSDADVYVLLGTSHYGGERPFTLTTKDYDTPLGPVPTDGAFIERLRRADPDGLFAEEILHRTEHSLEFQTLFLRFVLGDRPFTVVPVLVSSFHRWVAARQPPPPESDIGRFIAALGEALAAESRKVCLIAGADFAHVGLKFGDREPASPQMLAWVEAEDRKLIAALEKVDAAAFFTEVARDGDRRRICGFSPIYTMLAVLGSGEGKLLRYDHSEEAATGSAVTFAAVAIS